MGSSLPACAVEASTKASKPRLSQRKFNHANAAPIARPAPHKRSRSKANKRAATKPNRRGSQEIGRAVKTAERATAPLGAIAPSPKPPEHAAHSRMKPDAPETEPENRLWKKPHGH